MLDPGGDSKTLRSLVHARDQDLAVQVDIACIQAEVLGGYCEYAVQVVARLEPFANHAIKACAAQVECLPLDRFRKTSPVKAQRTVQEYAYSRAAFHVAARLCMSKSTPPAPVNSAR